MKNTFKGLIKSFYAKNIFCPIWETWKKITGWWRKLIPCIHNYVTQPTLGQIKLAGRRVSSHCDKHTRIHLCDPALSPSLSIFFCQSRQFSTYPSAQVQSGGRRSLPDFSPGSLLSGIREEQKWFLEKHDCN